MLDKLFRVRNNLGMSKMRKILKTMMDRAGHNAHDIFRDTGIQPSTIYRFFSNPKGDLKAETVRKLARLYGITESQLRGDVPINGMETPPEQFELKDLLTLDEYRLMSNVKTMSDESRGVLYRLAEMLALAEPQADYRAFSCDDRRPTDRRIRDVFPNPQLRIGEARHKPPPAQRRLKNRNDRFTDSEKSSRTA